MPFGMITRRHFTDVARAAALEARRRKQEARAVLDGNDPEVFVVRDPDGAPQFQWEIRRFGGVVLDRSDAVFLRVSDARSAGTRALSSRLEQVE